MLKEYANLQQIALKDEVYVDDNGLLGDEYPLGTYQFPVLTLAQARTICGLRNILSIRLRGSHNIDAAMERYNFKGYQHLDVTDLISFNGADVDGSSFWNLVLTGAQGGTGYIYAYNSVLINATSLRGVFDHCKLVTAVGLATGGATDNIDFVECYSLMGAVTITVNTPDLVNFYGWRGAMTLATMGGGTVNIYATPGSRITIANTCTAGTINIYGDAVIDNRAAGTAVHDFTINSNVSQIVAGNKSLVESWQDTLIDDTIWAPRIDPATGIPWAIANSGAFRYCQCTPNASETARLRGLHYWVQNWLAAPVNLVVKRLCMEFPLMLGVPANVDNTTSFFGLMPAAASLRTTNNIIGFALLADVLQTVTDSGGAETVNTGFGETLTNHNKLKIVIQEAEVLFYLNEQVIAVHTTNVPTVPMLPTFYIATEAGGACALAVGRNHIWDETIERL